MSHFKNAVLKVVSERPEFRKALRAELSSQIQVKQGSSLNTTLEEAKGDAMGRWFDGVWTSLAQQLSSVRKEKWEQQGSGTDGWVLSPWNSEAGGRFLVTYDFHRSALTLAKTGMGPKKLMGVVKIQNLERMTIRLLVKTGVGLVQENLV